VSRLLPLVLCCLLSAGVAASAVRRVSASPGTTPPPQTAPAGVGQQPREEGPGGTLVVTPQTEVLLDGRPCRYELIPAGAVITFAEVDLDGKTLVRIHFRRPR
jgi:hypothetical protein